MSAELTRARQQLNNVRALLKQDSQVAAAQSIHAALAVFLKAALMKVEREEFELLIESAIGHFNKDEFVSTVAKLDLNYEVGEEKALYQAMRDVVATLGEAATTQAKEKQRLREEKKLEWFNRGVGELHNGELTKGQATLVALLREYRNEPELKGLIGEALIQVSLYEPAIAYLTEAIDEKPDMLPLYNLIGIALRRLKQFKTAESYYLRASEYLRNDPNLYFNIGRLYLDWEKWPKAAKAAECALKLNPNFVEAQKLLKYVTKKMTPPA